MNVLLYSKYSPGSKKALDLLGTGLIDMDIITTGRTAATKIRMTKIAEQAKELMKANLSRYSRSTNV